MRANVIDRQLITHLMDAHAVEEQSLGLLRRARRTGAREGLLPIYDEHLSTAEQHRRLLEDRLHAHGARPSALKDAAMRLGALNWTVAFQAQPSPGRATALLFALTYLKMAGYELLRSVAARASDVATVEIAERMLSEEHNQAARLSANFDEAVEAAVDSPHSAGDAFGELRRTLARRAERARLGSV
ncbi:MAG TPA: DUF892 family protein [Solirubrobacteraceae bacterium]|nr:DUF892 family protein [Solirubrobacteraceae bacterium]